MVKTREEQLLRKHSEHQKQLQQVIESLKDKLSQSEGKTVTLTAGRHNNISNTLVLKSTVALESTQAELFDLKSKFDEEGTAKYVLLSW